MNTIANAYAHYAPVTELFALSGVTAMADFADLTITLTGPVGNARDAHEAAVALIECLDDNGEAWGTTDEAPRREGDVWVVPFRSYADLLPMVASTKAQKKAARRAAFIQEVAEAVTQKMRTVPTGIKPRGSAAALARALQSAD